MKPFVLAASLLITSTAYAVHGPFFYTDVGQGSVKSPSKNIFGTAAPLPGERTLVLTDIHTRGGVTETVGFGYRFNNRFAVSGEMAHIPGSKYVKKQCSFTKSGVCHAGAESDELINVDSFKILSSVYQQIFTRLAVRVDAGVALAMEKIISQTYSSNPQFSIPSDAYLGTRSSYTFRPVVGLAFEYLIRDKYSLGLRYSKIFGLFGVGDSRYVPDQDSTQIELRIYY